MRRLAYEIGCLILAFAFFAPMASVILRADEVATPKGAVILTIAGKITNWNRGGFDPVVDGYHKHHRFNFDRAMTFDRAMLEALPQAKVKAFPPIEHKARVYQGPLLKSVLEAAGTDNPERVTLIALDGYTVELTRQDLDRENLILAMSADGVPLGGSSYPVSKE